MNIDCFIKLNDVSRRYTQGNNMLEALKHAFCAVLPGDRIAVTGFPGSGKSTLLHIMGGLDTPTSGTVIWPLLGEEGKLRPGQMALFRRPGVLLPH